MTFPLPALDPLGMAEGAEGSWDLYRSRVSGRPRVCGRVSGLRVGRRDHDPGRRPDSGPPEHRGQRCSLAPQWKVFEEALDQLEFMVAIDLYINETTRHADIILPAVGPFEKGHYDLFYHTYNTDQLDRLQPSALRAGRARLTPTGGHHARGVGAPRHQTHPQSVQEAVGKDRRWHRSQVG